MWLVASSKTVKYI